MVDVLERKAIISGIGQSTTGRRLNRRGIELTLESILAALEDSGLDRSEIDGISAWPGYKPEPAGYSPVSITEIKEALDLKLNWYSGGAEASQMGGIINACMAVATGQARHVICYRTVTESTAQMAGTRSSLVGAESERVSGFGIWQSPFGALSATNWVGLIAERYFHEFGATREQLAQIALNARKNASLNPKAIYRSPLTLQTYLDARMISTPLCLYDCDVPVDGSVAIIISHRDTARDIKASPIGFEAVCGPLYGRDSWDQQRDLTRFAAEDAGKRLWSRTNLKPSDVDMAQLYDGFSFLTLLWLEGLGFCGRGEAAAFVENGTRIALDGELPLATGGGQLSAGRLHGLGHILEAVIQLRGLAGERQILGNPEVAAVSMGGGPIASAGLLVKL